MKCPHCERPSKHSHLLLLLNGKEIPDEEIDTRNGKGNPFGWSQMEVWHVQKDMKRETALGFIGSAIAGIDFYDSAKSLGYTFEMPEYDPNTI